MNLKTNLWIGTALRGLQILFGIVVLGISVTLAKQHYDYTGITPEQIKMIKDTGTLSGVPFILPWASTVGAITFVTGIANLAIAWTSRCREHIEMLIDIVIMFANVAAGTVGS